MSGCPHSIVLHQGCELQQDFYFDAAGVPENVELAAAWKWVIFHPVTLTEYVAVEGVATYVAPDPDNDVAGYGRVRFVIPADATLGQAWRVGQYKVVSFDDDGVPNARFERRLHHSRTPPESLEG